VRPGVLFAAGPKGRRWSPSCRARSEFFLCFLFCFFVSLSLICSGSVGAEGWGSPGRTTTVHGQEEGRAVFVRPDRGRAATRALLMLQPLRSSNGAAGRAGGGGPARAVR